MVAHKEWDGGGSPPPLISPEYAHLNRRLHETNDKYGISGARWAPVVKYLRNRYGLVTVCDYGCGKGYLKPEIDNCIEYDPAIPGKETPPDKVDLVICVDVLEHIEPDKLDNVLTHIHEISDMAYLFIALKESNKWLEDGRNTHLIVKSGLWWFAKLREHWNEVEVFPLWGQLEYYNSNRNKLSVLCR